MFCVRILEDDWLKNYALILSFPDPRGGRIIAFILKSDNGFFTSSEGQAYLRSSNLYFYTVEQYANAVLDEFFRERGIHE